MKSYEDIPNSNGMKVLRDLPDLETDGPINVVIRNITEQFWNEVIRVAEAPNKRTRVCAVGTPGIGKTLATAILIRMLLQRNRTVVYHIRTLEQDGWVYEFTPVQATEGIPFSVNVQAIREKDFEYAKVESLTQVEGLPNYYVVDPGQTKDTCCLNRRFNGRFVLVSEPDDRHWGELAFRKTREDTRGAFRYIPIWSLDELMSARPYMIHDIPNDEIKRRHRQVGGVPSNVFTHLFDGVLAEQKRALNAMTRKQMKTIASDGWSDLSDFSPKQPKSAIMAYGWSGDNYKQENVEPISETVREAVLAKCQFWSGKPDNSDES
jgi:hypothetical protein